MSLLLSLLASSGNTLTKNPDSSDIELTKNVNIHIDANSLYAQWIAPGIEKVGKLSDVITSSGASVSNTSIPGQTWDDLYYNSNDLTNSFVSGKKNVLITGETTNQIFNAGSDVQTTIQKAQRYISARKAEHPEWIILLGGTIPRADLETDDLNREANQKLIEVDNYQSSHLDDIGANGWIDFRSFSPEWFSLRDDGFSAHFMDSSDTCNTYSGSSTVDYVHPIGTPRVIFADAISDALAKLDIIK